MTAFRQNKNKRNSPTKIIFIKIRYQYITKKPNRRTLLLGPKQTFELTYNLDKDVMEIGSDKSSDLGNLRIYGHINRMEPILNLVEEGCRRL